MPGVANSPGTDPLGGGKQSAAVLPGLKLGSRFYPLHFGGQCL